MTLFNKTIASLTLLVFVGLAAPARADFAIEPYLGVGLQGQLDNNNTDTPANAFKGDLSGTAFGARLGWGMLGFNAGVEYMMGNLTIANPKLKISGTKEDSEKATLNDLGVYVGFNFPILLRVYASYFLQSNLKYNVPGTTTEAKHQGTGYKIGVGYTGLPIPFLSINLELQANVYDKDDTLTDLAGYSAFKTTLAETWLNVSLLF